MPEAPVDEDCDALTPKDNVRAPSKAGHGRKIYAIAKAGRVQHAPNSEFWLRIA